MAKEAYYFSHDSNARHDPKITALRGVYGSEGYGWWWMLIEMMREADGYRLDMKSKYAFNAYAMQLQCECNAIASFVHDCIHEFNLFLSDGEYFWSESLLRRMEIRDEKSAKARESANKRWQKTEKDANASENDANAPKIDALKESKGKRKESKTHYADCVTMTEQEYQKLTTLHGDEAVLEMIDILNSYKASSGKRYVSDYHTMTGKGWVLQRFKQEQAKNPKKREYDPFKPELDAEPLEGYG